jgi:hypothetical protein
MWPSVMAANGSVASALTRSRAAICGEHKKSRSAGTRAFLDNGVVSISAARLEKTILLIARGSRALSSSQSAGRCDAFAPRWSGARVWKTTA